MASRPPPLRAAALADQIRALLRGPHGDEELLRQLEPLTREPAFGGLTWLWGPPLYTRDRARFRPFILSHFASWYVDGKKWGEVRWKQHADALGPWLERADGQDDVEMFRRLYFWMLSDRRRGADPKRWRADLVQRFGRAASPSARHLELQKLDLGLGLDEPTALTLYRQDPGAARPFILAHLPGGFWGNKRKLWQELHGEATAREDDELAHKLYRRQIPIKKWGEQALALCAEVTDAGALCDALERRHPEGWGLDLGKQMYAITRARGRDVLPYLMAHLRDVWSGWLRGGYDRMLDLARQEGWEDLWAALLRVCSRPKEYNREVARLVEEGGERPRRQLLMLTGVSREYNFPGFGLAQVHQLDDATALALYRRYPALARGPFRQHLQGGWDETYPGLMAELMQQQEEQLLDYLAARALTRGGGWALPKKITAAADRLVDYYLGLDPESPAFARRACAVLTQVPAYAIWSYDQLIRSNRLARLLFERSLEVYLADPDGMSDLVEAPEIHVQALAYRALALDDDRARELAEGNLDVLMGTLLRPLHRRTRLPAFGALENAARTEALARRVHGRARQALDLPDSHYPKGELIGLIGRLLHRWPALQGDGEGATVHRRASGGAA